MLRPNQPRPYRPPLDRSTRQLTPPFVVFSPAPHRSGAGIVTDSGPTTLAPWLPHNYGAATVPLDRDFAAPGAKPSQTFAGPNRRRSNARLRRRSFVVSAGLILGGIAPLVLASPAGASNSVSTLQAKAARIAEQVAILQTKLQVLSEEYDQQRTHLGVVEVDIKKDVAATNRAENALSHDRKDLVVQAIDTYVSDGNSAGVSSILSAKSSTLPAQQAYLQSAADSLTTAITNYRMAAHALVIRTQQLSLARAQSESTLNDTRERDRFGYGRRVPTRRDAHVGEG